MALIEQHRARNQRLEKTREAVDADRITQELERIALADPRRIFDKDGRVVKPLDLDEDTARAISSFKVRQGKDGTAVMYDIKLADKMPAMKALGTQLGMSAFIDRQEVVHRYEDMTDEELAQEQERLRQELEATRELESAHSAPHTIQ